MERETFRKGVEDLLANGYQRMNKYVGDFCDTRIKWL